MNANLEKLRQSRMIQAHHWQAAIWLSTVPPQTKAMREIAENCRLVEYHSKDKIDPYTLLFKVCVARETITANDIVVGVLRESLNGVHRIMCHNAGKKIERQTYAGTTSQSGR